mmetsp:Transcript_86468/g.201185  ORF Transcript_86468/g.201185 Transcript_86468/m.201185 type:complete len:231 (-) Transcript_86468:2415-3107(-)
MLRAQHLGISWCALWANLLPGDALTAGAPAELHLVDGAGRDLLVPAVNDPALTAALGIGALDEDQRAAPGTSRVEAKVRDAVQADDKAFHERVAQNHCVGVGAVLVLLHVVITLKAAPGAVDGDPRVWRVHELVILVLEHLPAIAESALVCERGNVIGLELVAKAIRVVLAAIGPGRLAGEVVDRPQRHGARERDLLDLFVLQLLPAGAVGAELAHGPDLGVRVRAADAE